MELLLKNLKTAIFDVLEHMYFLLPDTEEIHESLSAEEDNFCAISIGIKGDPTYVLTFVFDKRLAETMTVDILGISESEITNEMLQKCLKETANIIAGKFLLSFVGQQSRNITLPHNRKADVFGKYELIESNKLKLSFNGYCVNSYIDTVKI
ncbi:MAG: chemotaxis protein CheX [Candidatus Latescibacteria bacterium]|nr:chemotaxis protein CheX [Candidatus Latescibacterota bacterium]